MDVREKLVELINDCRAMEGYGMDLVERQVDHLIANGVTVQEWISVDDRLPEEKVNYIVHYRHAYCDNDDYWAIGMCFYDGEKFRLNPAYKVTHWMPIPQPPNSSLSELKTSS